MEWWKKTIIYECYPKSFLDTTGSGTGDLRGIKEKLGYLESLGVGGIWLTPVYRSPMVDNGYDIANYYEIDPSYGTMEDMEELIAEAKKHHIRIIMDLVFNHTSDQNPWFLASKQARDNDKSDWYIWRDGKADGSAPTNWRGIFGGSAWTYCAERGQYYLHTFASQQPDLNWANEEVQKEVANITNFWIKKGVGGFRIDAITYIKKPDVFVDGEPDGEDGMCSVHTMTANTTGILDYLHTFRQRVKGEDIFLVAEANGVASQELDQWVGTHGVFEMLMEFSHINIQFQNGELWCRPNAWTHLDLKQILQNSQDATKDNGWYPIFFENHDQSRSVNHFFADGCDTNKAAKVLAVLLYTLRGTPFLYQGEELGLANEPLDQIEMYNDIGSKGQYAFALQEGLSQEEALACVHRFSRDNARMPMQWNMEENAGFTTGTPWLPLHRTYRQENVEVESEDASSVLSFYRTLAVLRQKYPVLLDGSFAQVLADHANLFGYVRENETERALILVNFSSEQQTYQLDEESAYTLVLSQGNHTAGVMEGYETCVFVKEK